MTVTGTLFGSKWSVTLLLLAGYDVVSSVFSVFQESGSSQTCTLTSIWKEIPMR